MGWFISKAEILKADFNWYAINLIGIHISSYSLIFYTLNKFKLKIAVKPALFFFIFSCFLFTTVNFQFTFVSSVACFSGLLIFLFGVKNSHFGAGLFFFFLGSALRIESGLVILVFFLITVFLLKPSWINKNRLLKCGVFILILIGLKSFNYYVYASSSEEWKVFNELKDLRQGLNNNSQFRNLKDDYPEKFKANNDELDLLYEFFSDPQYFDLNRVKSVKEVTDRSDKNYLYMFRLIDFVIPIFFFALLFFLLARKNRKFSIGREAIALSVIFIIYIVIMLYLNLNSRVNTRAFYAISAGLLFPLIISAGKNLEGIQNKRMSWVFFLFSGFIVVLAGFSIYHSGNELAKTEKINSWLKDYQSKDIFIFPGGSLSTRNHKILENEPYFIKRNFKFAGWLSGTPFKKNILQDYRELLNTDTVLLIEKRSEQNIERLLNVFSKVYNIPVKYYILAEFENIYMVKFNISQ